MGSDGHYIVMQLAVVTNEQLARWAGVIFS